MPRQEYTSPPQTINEVRGESSKTIYRFMTGMIVRKSYPIDVDDWERNRALLLCYPEWRERLPEMATVSKKWKNLVERWDDIEKLYDKESISVNTKESYEGECYKLIWSCVQ